MPHNIRIAIALKRFVRKFRFIVVMPLVLATIGCTHAVGTAGSVPARGPEDTKRLQTLLALNDLNERAFAWHHYCMKNIEPLNPAFLANFRTVSDELFDQCQGTLGWKPDYVVGSVMKRRAHIQATLLDHYKAGGCQSAEAQAAQSHYLEFGRLGEGGVMRLIDGAR